MNTLVIPVTNKPGHVVPLGIQEEEMVTNPVPRSRTDENHLFPAVLHLEALYQLLILPGLKDSQS